MSVKTDNSQTLVNALEEIERLRGRVSGLEHLIRYAQVESGVCMCGDEIESHNQASGHSPVDIWDHAAERALEGTSEAWLLRKQAEAVEAFAEWSDPHWPKSQAVMIKDDARSHAYELRTKADELEAGGGDDPI